MGKPKRKLSHIKEDIKVISSNKLNISQSKLLFMGVMYEIILSKELFPKNKDLKGFINKVFVVRFGEDFKYRDYLYSSRTLLASRLQRTIYYGLEYNQIIEIINEIYNILPESERRDVKNKRNDNMDEEVNEWMNFIRNKE